MKKIQTLVLIILISFQFAAAQEAPKKFVSGNFNNLSIEPFVKILEQQTGYHFYYDIKAFDSLRVSLKADDESLESVLNKAFDHTDFHFTLTKDLQVFLSKGKQIRLELAPAYLQNTFPSLKQPEKQEAVADYTEDNKKVPEATTENKLYEIGAKTNTIKAGNSVITGYIRDIKSGESVIGASIYVPGTKTGVATDQYGFFTISLPNGRNILYIRGIGMRESRRQIMLYSNGKLNVEMQEQVNTLKEVRVTASKTANVQSVELGVTRLDIKDIKQIPTAFGEPDVLKVVLTLPGVTSVGEATTGFNVRGGSADENLILLDGSTIFNPAHFFGFFAAFNPDIVKNIELFKSSIPEKYGGRLSSVLEVTNREGNRKIFTGSAGVGLLTGRLNIEGPIIKDKMSFIFGARTTYSNWLLHLLPASYRNSAASFNDFNLGVSYQVNDKNNIAVSGYLSNDKFKLNSDTAYAYSNRSVILKWKHNFNSKLYSLISGGIDDYRYSISSTANPINAFDLHFRIHQANARADFTYYVSNKNTIDFGLSSLLYHIDPGTFEPNSKTSLVIPEVVAREQALENALYFGDKYDITSKLTISAGIRYNIYNYLGAQTVNQYAPNLPKSPENVTDSVFYPSGQVIKTYLSPDIRISARYLITDNFSVKAGYNSLHQYIHLLSNSTSISPTDVYKLSDPNIKPTYGDQVSLGFFKNSKNNAFELSFEVYYKRIRDYLDYKSGATLVLNQHIEQAVLNTEGKAYGAEFLVKKNSGKLTGWLSYTYSRTLLRQDDPNAGELINGGAYYPANYDKPNNVNFTGNYKFTHRYSVSLDIAYSTGRPITLPIAKYDYDGSQRVFYSDRNAYRIPDYFRTDFSVNIEGNHRVHQRTHNSWSFGVYNLTGRQNAYSVFFQEQGGVISGYKLSIFGSQIPYINYNIRF